MVRSYAPYDKTKQSSQAGKKKERKERFSTEWDIRIDCDASYADEICNTLHKAEHLIEYCLVSGIEEPDTVQYGSKDHHVHIALVLKYALRRDQVLTLCRGTIRKTEEYCTPRNKKFTYAGWYMHHTKIDWKLTLEPCIRLEIGTLPEDEETEYNVTAIKRLFTKFACDDEARQEIIKIKFKKYLD